ncbi:predicted protein, partial [Nematostella vectensis]
YVDQFVLSQTLAKSLAQVCTKKLSTLYLAAEQMQSEQPPNQATKPQTNNSFPTALSTNGSNDSSFTPVTSSSSTSTVLSQYKNCSQHNSLVLALGAIIQAVTICCPGALVWNSTVCSSGQSSSSNNSGDQTKPQVLGSPLDRLPMAPSALPMPGGGNNNPINQEVMLSLLASEESVKTRGLAVESRWSPDKYQDKTSAVCFSVIAVNRVLTTLEILDKYDFTRADNTNCIDLLYAKIFTSASKGNREVNITCVFWYLKLLPPHLINMLESSSSVSSSNINFSLRITSWLTSTDEAIALLLCEWAISKHRVGKHRAFVVAKLLQRRQSDLLNKKDDSTSGGEESNSSRHNPIATPVCQKVLLEFLDNYAPVVESYQHSKGDPSFAQLVLLFVELVRHDVFSHNAYLCTLISRGDLQPTPAVSIPSPPRQIGETPLPLPVMSDIEECVQEGDAHGVPGMDVPMSTHEDVLRKDLSSELELDRELTLHQEQLERLLDQGDAEGCLDPDQAQSLHMAVSGVQGIQTDPGLQFYSSTTELSSSHDVKESISIEAASHSYNSKSQHLQYATHFPIPHEAATTHECNQRLVLLYGVGKARTEAINKSKEVTKLLVKTLYDLAGSGHGSVGGGEYSQCLTTSELSERRAKEEQWTSLYSKFSSLPCFDQYMAVAECANALRDLRMSNPPMFGLTSRLPSIDQLVFLYDLYELSGDIHGLLEFIAFVLMPDGDDYAQIQIIQNTSVIGTLPTKSIVTIAMLRRYHSCLVLMPDHIARVFKGLLQTVENIADPAVCTSSERCILAYLHDIYAPQGQLGVKFAEIFSTAHQKIKDSICSTTKPSATTAQYDSKFMTEYFQNPRTKRLDGIWDHLRMHKRPSDVYSFVCNAMMNVCNCQNSERLYDIAVLCAEVTAHYSRLSSEWLGILKALCCSSSSAACFVDFLLEVDVSDLSIHESVATFTALMIARHCFSLEDVIYHVALPSLLAALPSDFLDKPFEYKNTAEKSLMVREVSLDPN